MISPDYRSKHCLEQEDHVCTRLPYKIQIQIQNVN